MKKHLLTAMVTILSLFAAVSAVSACILAGYQPRVPKSLL